MTFPQLPSTMCLTQIKQTGKWAKLVRSPVPADDAAGVEGGAQIHASLETQEGQAAVTHLICDAIDNDSKMVIAAEMIGFGSSHRHGKWGIDEPVPAAVPEPPKRPEAE